MDNPETQPPSPAPSVLPLTGDGGAQWRPVSPELSVVRQVSTTAAMVPPALAAAVAAAFITPWLVIVTVVLTAVWLWLMWLVPRQVAAISWAELPEELAIRKGRLWRSLVTIPYGRIQYVDISSGPYKRAKGLADITVSTASPASSGDIPGLPVDVAEELRVRLAAHGEAQRAGL